MVFGWGFVVKISRSGWKIVIKFLNCLFFLIVDIFAKIESFSFYFFLNDIHLPFSSLKRIELRCFQCVDREGRFGIPDLYLRG